MPKCEKCGKECGCKSIILPVPAKKFPDGGNYRIEVSGIETAAILGAVVEEAKKQKIPFHRAICAVNGSAFYSDEQLTALAHLAAKERVEAIICPGDLAHGFFGNPNRNLNWQNVEEADAYIKEIMRCVDIGFRGFLVWTGPMLKVLNGMRFHGELPKETIFKVSTFANSCNLLDFSSHAEDGANTINAANGLTLENLSEIRELLDEKVAIDCHIVFWQQIVQIISPEKNINPEVAVLPYNRIDDAPEIARVCSPVYFKFESGNPGIGVYDLSKPTWNEKNLAELKRKDVRTAAEIVKTIGKKYPQLNLSDWGPKDLRVPKV